MQLPAQAHQFFPFGFGQAFLGLQELAIFDGSLAVTVGGVPGGKAKLTPELRGLEARSNQLDHLLAYFRWVRRSYSGHFRLLGHKERCVRGTGSTPSSAPRDHTGSQCSKGSGFFRGLLRQPSDRQLCIVARIQTWIFTSSKETL